MMLCTVVFQVSSGFLINIYTDNSNPVPKEAPEDPVDFVTPATLVSVYLVAPRWASSAILKFSGTLGMSHHSDR